MAEYVCLLYMKTLFDFLHQMFPLSRPFCVRFHVFSLVSTIQCELNDGTTIIETNVVGSFLSYLE